MAPIVYALFVALPDVKYRVLPYWSNRLPTPSFVYAHGTEYVTVPCDLYTLITLKKLGNAVAAFTEASA